jgi:hypothetical protein
MADRAESEDETEELRSAVLQTATSVLQIRQRADHLVTDEEGKVTDFNDKYLDMWKIPRVVLEAGRAADVRELYL